MTKERRMLGMFTVSVAFLYVANIAVAAVDWNGQEDPFYSEGVPKVASPNPLSVNESVDPFSGHLMLVHTDLWFPSCLA